MPVAIVLAVLSTSFWVFLGIAVVAGLIVAGIIASLYIARLRDHLASANPLQRFSAEIQGANDTSLRVRFVLMTSLSGGLIIAMWFGIASGIAYLIR